jgi:hypothetical protein
MSNYDGPHLLIGPWAYFQRQDARTPASVSRILDMVAYEARI